MLPALLKLALAVAAIAAMIVPPAQVAADPSSSATATVRCKSGEKRARIGGRTVCLKARKRCNVRFRRQYRRHGFRCVRSRLVKIPKPVVAPVSTPPAATTPAPEQPPAAPPAAAEPGTGTSTSGETAAPIGPARLSITQSVLRPGDTVQVRGAGFAAGGAVDLVLHSTPTDVGSVVAGADGSFQQTIEIPETIESGAHNLIGTGFDYDGNPVEPSVPLTVDVTAPTIVSVTATPSTVSPGDTVVVSAHVTDDTRVRTVGLQATLVGSAGAWSFCDGAGQRTAGSAGDGTWTMSCQVPEQVLNGDYSIYPYAQDIAGNWVNTNGGPTTDVRGQFTVTGGSDSVSPPEIVSIDVTPADAGPGDTITISAHVTSEGGLKGIELQATRDGDPGSWTFCDKWGTRTSGTATDGVWTITCEVPDPVLNGSYTITPYAQDEFGQWVNSNGGPPDDTRGNFTISGSVDHADPPDIVSIDVTPTSVTSGDTLTISAHVTSSVGVGTVQLQANSTEVAGNTPFCEGAANRTSGTVTDGVWTLTCVVPNVVVPGDYEVTPYAQDILGQWVNTNGGALDDARGYFTVG